MEQLNPEQRKKLEEIFGIDLNTRHLNVDRSFVAVPWNPVARQDLAKARTVPTQAPNSTAAIANQEPAFLPRIPRTEARAQPTRKSRASRDGAPSRDAFFGRFVKNGST